MTRYAVGDLQGCLEPLQRLLDDVSFNPRSDQLWLVGDLINRGPQSLETLDFIIGLGDCTRTVLGNHDLHFLAVAFGVESPREGDTFSDILASPQRQQHCDWLRQQPLIYTDPSGDYSMVHAGIPPQWDIAQAHRLSGEIEQLLRGDDIVDFFTNMYGNQPDCWDEQLSGWDRYRLITNYFTRMRFCTAEGRLDLLNKTDNSFDDSFKPWFTHPQRKAAEDAIIFGHWASLEGRANTPHVYALDTGCVWGGCLTLLNLDNKTLRSVDCNDTPGNTH